MSMEESISLEETNKIRISLGLKPLTDDKAPANAKDQEAEDNYARQREKEAKEKETNIIQSRIAKVRNKKELNAKLKGATLGDADPDVDDTLKWLKRSKKKEKELAKKRQEELENMDRAFQGADYTEKDLEGLKVSHDFESMEDGEARILTLKDSRILDNEEDELHNIEIAEEERRHKNQELKVKRKDYTGFDDDEFVEPGSKRSVLSKYDEVIDGQKETGFRLGSSLSTVKSEKIEQEETTKVVNKSLLSLDYNKNIEISDYLQEGDVGFKKPKKKKRNNRRVPEQSEAEATHENGDDKMQVDEKPIIPQPRNLDVNFVDDDELQAALARSRNAKIHRRKKLSPEEVARRIAEQRQQSGAIIKAEEVDDDGMGEADGITLDDTSEFVRNITYEQNAVKQEAPQLHVPARQLSKQPSPDAQMQGVDEVIDELEAGEVVVKEEDSDEDMLDAIEDALRATEAEEVKAEGNDIQVGTAGEKTHTASGLASTLDILRQQGILARPSSDNTEREKIQLQRDLWLAEQRRRVAYRELERQKARGVNKDQATREYENRVRDQHEARASLDSFKDYKPDVNIVYYDEFGRELTPKEAWKALSHKFHGKGSGRMKTEKRLKRIAEEKKQEAMVSGDTPLSMNQAFQSRQEKVGQAHFVLSVGNRGAVPAAAEFLDAQPLSKGKTERARKKKESKNQLQQLQQQAMDSTGFITLPAPLPLGIESPVPQGGSGSLISTPSNASPAPRPGFARISSAAVETDTRSSTPIQNGDRTKVAFGFGMKRKAGGDHQDSPPHKKR